MFAGSPVSCHLPLAESPNPQSHSAASADLAEVNGHGSLQDWAFLLAEVITWDVGTSQYQITYLSQSKQALTTGLGYVNAFIPYYKGTSSSLASGCHRLSGSLRGSNGKVINTFTFSVLLPPVQIPITQSDKEKMKLQSVRLQVFSSMIGTVFNAL